jgi:hypothetical protein
LPYGSITAVIDVAVSQFATAPIREFVPLMAERLARGGLRRRGEERWRPPR